MNESKYIMASTGSKNSTEQENDEELNNLSQTPLINSVQSNIMNSQVESHPSTSSIINNTFDKNKDIDNSDDNDDEIVVMTYEAGEKKTRIDQPYDINPLLKYFNVNSTSAGTRWSRSVENAVIVCKKKAIGYKVLYINSYFKYMKLHRLFKWPLVFFTLVSLILQIIRSTLLSDDTPKTDAYKFTMNIVTVVVTAIIASITYLQNDKNYKNIANGCKKASSAFGTLSEEIGTILAIPRASRANPYQVLSGIQSDLSKLIKLHEDCEIPTSIYNEFDKMYNTDQSEESNKHKLPKKKVNGKTLIDENEILEKFVENVQNMPNDIDINSAAYHV